MRKIAEIRKDLSSLVAEVKAAEGKSVEEMNAYNDKLRSLQSELDLAIETELAEQRAAEQSFNDLQKKAGRSFSLVKFVRELSEGRGLTGVEAEAAEMGAKEYERMGLAKVGTVIPTVALRAAIGQNYGTAADGGNLVETMAPRYVEVLKKQLSVAQAGATVLTDLVGTLPVITTAQIAAGWGAEAAAATATKAAFAKASMTPHRNFIQTAVTKDLLRQTSLDVEAFLLDLMVQAHANLIEDAVFNGSGTSGQPTGLLTIAKVDGSGAIVPIAMGTNGAALDWAHIVAMESEINANDANRGRLSYITNAKVIGAAKTTTKAASGDRFIIEEGAERRMNGYPCHMSSYVPSNLTKGTAAGICSALFFGNWADLYIGEWGGLDIVVDPFTHAGSGEVVMTINAYNDVLVAQPKSFAVIRDIKA